MSNPNWRLRILGEFVLERDGEVVDRFGARREEALLAYLAIDATTPKRRDAIAADLWPDAEQAQGRKNISYNMFVMKKRLAEYGLADPFEDVGNRSLRLSGRVHVDAQEFAEALAAGVADTGRLSDLRRGLALYGGGLLPTYDEPWVAAHQEQYEELYRLAIQRMAEVMAPTGVQGELIRRIPTAAWRGVQLPPEVIEPETVEHGADDTDDLVVFAREAEAGLEGAEASAWVGRVDELYSVIEAYFTRAIEAGAPRPALEVAVCLWRYWYIKHETSEGRLWLERLFQMREGGSAELRARAFHALGCLASLERDAGSAIDHFERALKVWRKLERPDRIVWSLNSLGTAHQYNDEMELAADKYDQAIAIATSLGEDGVLAAALYNRARIAMDAQDYARATELLKDRLDVVVEGDDDGRAKTIAHLAVQPVGVTPYDVTTTQADSGHTVGSQHVRRTTSRAVASPCARSLRCVQGGVGTVQSRRSSRPYAHLHSPRVPCDW